MAYAGKRLDAIFLDFLTPATSVAQLPAVQLPVNELKINGHTRGKAADPGNQRLSVRFTRSDKPQHRRLCILSDPARRVKRGRRFLLRRRKVTEQRKIPETTDGHRQTRISVKRPPR